MLFLLLACAPAPTMYDECLRQIDVACDCGNPDIASTDGDPCSLTPAEREEHCSAVDFTVCDTGSAEYDEHTCEDRSQRYPTEADQRAAARCMSDLNDWLGDHCDWEPTDSGIAALNEVCTY